MSAIPLGNATWLQPRSCAVAFIGSIVIQIVIVYIVLLKIVQGRSDRSVQVTVVQILQGQAKTRSRSVIQFSSTKHPPAPVRVVQLTFFATPMLMVNWDAKSRVMQLREGLRLIQNSVTAEGNGETLRMYGTIINRELYLDA